MTKSESIANLAAAFVAAQAEFPIVLRDKKNPHFNSTYADLQSVRNAVRPVLQKHGLCYLQLPGGDGHTVTLQTMLLHSSGEWICDDGIAVACETKFNKDGKPISDPNGVMAIITYARRYGLGAITGVVTDDDDDGVRAAGLEARAARAVAAPKQSVTVTETVNTAFGPATVTGPLAEEVALINAIREGFTSKPHKDNWGKKHAAEIKALPLDAQERIRAEYNKATINAVSAA